jgi:hypothetical protein
MKRHPIYVVRTADFQGCGHQHQQPSQAHNCAVNTLTRQKQTAWAEVLRIRLHANSFDVKQNTVERIEQWFGKSNATASEIVE